ncbi:MAG: hypothetical protein ACMUHY_00585 [Thermoplasmatota archaeon]
MRLTNHAVGMPFEAFHRDRIQIPLVVNRHLLMGERDAVQNRRPSTELKFAIKYYDHRDARAVRRFLGAVEEMITRKGVKEVVEMGAVARLRSLLLKDDLKLVFDTMCVIVQAVSRDPKGLFSGELIGEDGLDILLNMMMIDEKPGSDRMVNAAREQYGKMIRGNALYIIGYVIGNGFAKGIMDPEMVKLLLERSIDSDPVSRGNALFCFRMAIESDPNHLFDFENMFARTLEMLMEGDEGVREEAVRLVQICLERNIVPGECIGDISSVIGELSGSGNHETAKAAESILYILKERGFFG